MTEEVTERTYLDMLRDELLQMQADRKRAADILIDDPVYRKLVLDVWDYDIAQQEKRIAKEQAQP